MKSIQEYWPSILKEIREFVELSKAENPELKKVWEETNQLMDDQFISTATEKGIARREKMLGIVPFADDTLESRRFRIQARWNETLPYTYQALVDKLNFLCGESGYIIHLETKDYHLLIKLELKNKRNFDDVVSLVRRMAPVNLVITVELRYNQYNQLRNYINNELSKLSYLDIREEVLA
jgi:hypothetical protein